MRDRTGLLKVAQRVVVFYCFFYSIVKVYAIIKGSWLLPNLMIILGLLVLGAIGAYLMKIHKYTWIYAGIGVVLISALRYYEVEWVTAMHEFFG
ncbi:hypothetical protein [Neptunitalea lumnitzerae]|uniref:Uncharacterized protein n=1 Tax=Neptunitalea lumnitzerae TaxID=2965509 RepID=A0ABQ5MHU1_9FLAO|nr:hypothetical protein [Neptunitalea sp. Y10]GLB48979.1 hypothetical protein Y10_13470 [Neptunitalea sp. Y10]